jgi:hypothetical protein
VFGSDDGPDVVLVAYAPEHLGNTFNIWDVNRVQRLIFFLLMATSLGPDD